VSRDDIAGRLPLRRDRALAGAALLGVAAMAAVDEIVFHQLLAWHHFYDRGTPRAALLSDGLLHAFELLAGVAGAFLLLDARRTHGIDRLRAWGGFCAGAGLFQVWDGLVHHKLLRLHQVRYDVADLLPYDVAWLLAGGLLLVAGLVLLARARRRRTAG
jgi:uncharacterized membrane protein